jgi:hypothetical protein
MFNMKPNALIYGARYDRIMEAFGGKGFFVENPKTEGRARRSDGLPRPRPRQRCDLAGLRQEAAAAPLAQLSDRGITQEGSRHPDAVQICLAFPKSGLKDGVISLSLLNPSAAPMEFP